MEDNKIMDAEADRGFNKDMYIAKKNEERNSLFAMLDEGTAETVKSGENYVKYLDMQSKLDHFSASNTILIQKQCPEASILKSYNEWYSDNVQIAKGEHAIAVLEPADYVKADGTTAHSFNVRKVFDVSQTYNGRRMNAPSVNRSPIDVISVLEHSSVAAVEAKEKIKYPDLDAYYDNDERKIYVSRKHYNDVVFCQQLAMALAHDELSMSTDVYSKSDEAMNAVAVAYMFCRQHGIDTKGLAVERAVEELKGKEPKEVRHILSRQKNAFREISNRFGEELAREKQAKSKDLER